MIVHCSPRFVRLQRVHEMQTIVTDVCVNVRPAVRLSVTRLILASLYKNSWTDQDPVWGEHTWGPKVLAGHPDPPAERWDIILRDPVVSSEGLKLETWNFECISWGGGPSKSQGVKAGSRNLILNVGTPLISLEWLELHKVWVVHSMHPLPNYFGLLFLILQDKKEQKNGQGLHACWQRSHPISPIAISLSELLTRLSKYYCLRQWVGLLDNNHTRQFLPDTSTIAHNLNCDYNQITNNQHLA